MSGPKVKPVYKGTAPLANATAVLYTTVDGFLPGNFFALAGVQKVVASITHDAALSIVAYKSKDRGKTWTEIGTTGSIASAGDVATIREWLVSPYADFKLEIENGAADQTVWEVDLSLDCRASAT